MPQFQDFRRPSLKENDIVPSLPGKIRKTDGTYSDVLTEIGLSGTPVTSPDDTRVSTIRVDGSEYELTEVLNKVKSSAAATEALTTRGDILYRNATVPARLAKGTAGQVLTQGADDPAWAAWGGPAASVTIADTGLLYAASNVEAALAEIGAKPILTIPETGTIEGGTVYRNSGPDANEPMGWVVTESGTQGTLVGTTGSITMGKNALTVNALEGLAVGNYISIAGVSGVKSIALMPAALGSTTVLAEAAAAQKYICVTDITGFATGEVIEVGRGTANEELCQVSLVSAVSTTVDEESASDQKVLKVASTNFIYGGDPVLIAKGTGSEEWKIVATVQAGVSLTLTENLANTHAAEVTVETSHIRVGTNLANTHAALETVTNCIGVSPVADATVDAAAVSYFNAVFSPYGYVNTGWKAWTPALTWADGTPPDLTTAARYKITDKTVFFNFYTSGANGNGATALTIALPVAPKDNNSFIPVTSLQLQNTTWADPKGYIDDGASVIEFYGFSTATSDQAIKMLVSGFYEIA